MWYLTVVVTSHFSSAIILYFFFFFFKQKTAYEMRISDWSSDVCSSDLNEQAELADADEKAGHANAEVARIEQELTRLTEKIAADEARRNSQIGRASCRERVCKYV